MNKIVLLILGLALYVRLSTGCAQGEPGCSGVTSGVASTDGCDPATPVGHCCRQAAQVLALTSASARAASFAYANVHACAHACTGTEAYAYATACATAHVCITQSVCLSINTGKCCEVSSTIAANASSYASAAAFATASAWASARAAAAASAGASASASSAASLHAQASALITSSCCNFNLRIYALVEAIGNFSAQAAVAVDAAVNVAVQAELSAHSCSAASDSVSASTSAMLSAGINNCCVANRTAQYASDSAFAFNVIVDRNVELFQFVNDAYDAIQVGVDDYNEIIDPVELETILCAPECKDILLTCCSTNDCCGTINSNDCCQAAHVYVYVAMEAKAFAQALAAVEAYAVVALEVRTKTKAAILVAAGALVNVALLTDVNVKSCCSIVVTVSTQATAVAGSIGSAFAFARACASAYADGFAQAGALSYAIASANATAFAFAGLSYVGCCDQPCCAGGDCCVVAHQCEWSEAGAIAANASEAYAITEDPVLKTSHCWDIMKDTETALVISVVSTQTAYLLQCCCCTKPPTTTTTKRLSFSSSSFTFKG